MESVTAKYSPITDVFDDVELDPFDDDENDFGPVESSEIFDAETLAEIEKLEKLERQWLKEAKQEVSQAHREFKDSLNASSVDLVDFLHERDIPLHTPEADRIAAQCGYRTVGWNDQRNVERRAKERTNRVNRATLASRLDAWKQANPKEDRETPKPVNRMASHTAPEPTQAPAVSVQAVSPTPDNGSDLTEAALIKLAHIVNDALTSHAAHQEKKNAARIAAKTAKLHRTALEDALTRLHRQKKLETQRIPTEQDYLDEAQQYFIALAERFSYRIPDLEAAWKLEMQQKDKWIAWRMSRAGGDFGKGQAWRMWLHMVKVKACRAVGSTAFVLSDAERELRKIEGY